MEAGIEEERERKEGRKGREGERKQGRGGIWLRTCSHELALHSQYLGRGILLLRGRRRVRLPIPLSSDHSL